MTSWRVQASARVERKVIRSLEKIINTKKRYAVCLEIKDGRLKNILGQKWENRRKARANMHRMEQEEQKDYQ